MFGKRNKFAGKPNGWGEGQVYDDPQFPLETEFFAEKQKKASSKGKIEWKRPYALTENPQFFVEGATRDDVNQGAIENCWFVSAVSTLTVNWALFDQVVPIGQSFEHKYHGIFHFRFWRFGEWLDITVDDRLPTQNGKLLCAHSNVDNEFWVALLEKAFAKLHGGYSKLQGGSFVEAICSLTGGIVEHLSIDSSRATTDITNRLKFIQTGKIFACCSIGGTEKKAKKNAQSKNGLIKNHAYSVTDLKEFKLAYGAVVHLIRIRNPWGKVEWNGAWSDRCPLWKDVSEAQLYQIKFPKDGEFWMCLSDFRVNFTDLDICEVNPVFIDPTWTEIVRTGAWIKDKSAGGSNVKLVSLFHLNPQHLLDLSNAKPTDAFNVIFSLSQMSDSKTGRKHASDLLSIGLSVYEVPPETYRSLGENVRLGADFFLQHDPIHQSENYLNLPAISLRCWLKPGFYCLIPSTHQADCEGQFVLRYLYK